MIMTTDMAPRLFILLRLVEQQAYLVPLFYTKPLCTASPIKQYMVQNDMQAQPIDSGSAASKPTLL